MSPETISFSRSADMPFMERMSVLNTRSHFSALHEGYTLCLNLGRGGAEWLYRGQTRRGDEKMMMLMEPGETHRTVRLLAATGSFRVLHLHAEWMQQMAAEAGMPTPHFNAAVLTQGDAYAALLAFHRSVDDGASLLERQTRLVTLLDVVCRHGAERAPPFADSSDATANLRRARHYLIENYDQKIVLDDIVSASGLSKFHLVRSFSRCFGMTPHVFLNHVRISRARTFLRQGKQPIAAELGFFDQSHFIQVFRKITGITPGQYAEIPALGNSGT